MPILQRDSVMKFGDRNSGYCAITQTQLLLQAGSCSIHCVTAQDPLIFQMQKPPIGVALSAMPAVS